MTQGNSSAGTVLDQVPVIDISRLHNPATLTALDAACREWGFFQVMGHGIDTRALERLMGRARAFFALPAEVKRAISRNADNPWGYFDRELTKNTPDWKQIYDYGPAEGRHIRPQWPELAGFRVAVLDHYQACEQLALRLLGAVSTLLGMPADYLAGAFVPNHSSFLRLNYYPVCPAPARPPGLSTPEAGHLGINHHTDAGALTLLVQDRRAGLEVFRDGDWYLVEPLADALVINIGDIVQVWSNDRYQAAIHRVLANPVADRLSAAFFFNPDYAAEYAPLPAMVDAAHPPRYRPINWGEFRGRRAAGDYADYGTEVQISDYRVVS